MRIEVQHVQKRGKAGWRYRRKVPPNLRSILGKTEIVIPLGRSEQEALKKYAKAHAVAERLLRDAASGSNVPSPAPQRTAHMTPLELHQWASQELREMKLDRNWTGPSEPEDADPEDIARDVIAERIAAEYPVDDAGNPVGVKPKDAALLQALALGAKNTVPEPTLKDAERLYIAERIKGRPNAHKKELETKRALAYIPETLERDPTLRSISRAEAKEVRDRMLEKVKASSAERYLNVINAVINYAVKEVEQLSDVKNRFAGLEIKRDSVAKDDRLPFTPDQLKKARARVLARTRDDLQRIWRILEGTGCRIAEVSGLLLTDVVTEGELPHINLVFHPHRRLKTQGSVRKVPLLGDALAAAKEAIEAVEGGAFLFPRYNEDRGPDAVSAALMKQVRAVITDPKITVHSLRHTMADRLKVAGVSASDRELVLGHSSGKIGDDYGGDEARLRVATAAMKKAFAEPANGD